MDLCGFVFIVQMPSCHVILLLHSFPIPIFFIDWNAIKDESIKKYDAKMI